MTIEEQTKKGKVVLLDIEMEVCLKAPPPPPSPRLGQEQVELQSANAMYTQGVKQIKQSSISARYVFISPPSVDALESRLRGRGTEKEENIQKRLAQAKNELEYSRDARRPRQDHRQ